MRIDENVDDIESLVISYDNRNGHVKLNMDLEDTDTV